MKTITPRRSAPLYISFVFSHPFARRRYPGADRLEAPVFDADFGGFGGRCRGRGWRRFLGLEQLLELFEAGSTSRDGRHIMPRMNGKKKRTATFDGDSGPKVEVCAVCVCSGPTISRQQTRAEIYAKSTQRWCGTGKKTSSSDDVVQQSV